MTSVVKNANEEMHKSDPFDKPKPGTQFVVVTLRLRYTGGGKGSPYGDLTYGISGSSGIVTGTATAVAPNDLIDANDLFNGDGAEGDVVFDVKTSEVNSSLVLLVSPAFGNTRTVFQL